MKRQLDRLKGKRLVTGDVNLMTKDEICINATPNGVEVKEIGTDGKIKDLAGGSNSSSGGGGKMEYYKLNLDKYGDMGDDAPFGGIFYIGLGYPSLLRIKQDDLFMIGSYSMLCVGVSNVKDFLSAGIDAICFDPNIKIILNDPQSIQFNANNVKEYMDFWINIGASHADDALIPITEEEFYNLN